MPRLSPARRVTLAAGGAVLLAAIAWGALTVAATMGRTTTTSETTLATSAHRVTVDTGSGNIAVGPSTDGRVHVSTRLRYGLRRPQVRQRLTPAGVDLSARCRTFDPICDVRYQLTVPPDTDLVLTTGSGNLTVRATTGTVWLRTGSGDVRTDAVTGALVARSGSGNVTGAGIRSPTVDGHTGSGDIHLTLAAGPIAVALTTGSGNIGLELPAGLSYATDVRTGSGNRRVDVPTDPASRHRIEVSTGSGDVSIRPAPGR